jgi:hypothetical protein
MRTYMMVACEAFVLWLSRWLKQLWAMSARTIELVVFADPPSSRPKLIARCPLRATSEMVWACAAGANSVAACEISPIYLGVLLWPSNRNPQFSPSSSSESKSREMARELPYQLGPPAWRHRLSTAYRLLPIPDFCAGWSFDGCKKLKP